MEETKYIDLKVYCRCVTSTDSQSILSIETILPDGRPATGKSIYAQRENNLATERQGCRSVMCMKLALCL